ncbi:MAG: CTP-dependent riboflavin kinase [Candidatus Methanofastidiosa archaeon]|nr:CTP-dependent riboflavin kinase [Candidatus Methanofastidiosa archaeon]
MDQEDLVSLIPLAKIGAMDDYVYITSNELALLIGTSQQTANRRLQMLEKSGYLIRTGTSRRQQVKITDEGKLKLKELYFTLYNIFSQDKNEITIIGKLVTGMGEGKYYISRPGYRNQFANKFGFLPYPGTFNIILDDENHARLQSGLNKLIYIRIDGFQTEDRTFGAVKAYKAQIENNIEGALIIPYRTHHKKNIIEIIAPTFLRKELGINEGDNVKITVYG